MKFSFLLALTSGLILTPLAAPATEKPAADPGVRVAETECLQIIHCGIKDRKAKVSSTKCEAEKDGATHITPKGAGPCPEIE